MRTAPLRFAASLILIGPVAAGQGEEAVRIAAGRGGELLELAASCAKARLYNDEERLLLEARALRPDDAGTLERLEDMHRRRVAVANGDAAKEYRGYLESDAYRKARADAAARRAALDKRTMAAYLDAAQRGRGVDGLGGADDVLWPAFALDPADARLRRLLGTERLEAFTVRRRETSGIGRLSLGKAIRGRDIDAQDLAGRVVLWRSFSL